MTRTQHALPSFDSLGDAEAPTTFNLVRSRTSTTIRRLLLALFLIALATTAWAEEHFYADVKFGQSQFTRGFEQMHVWDFDGESASPSLVLGGDLHDHLAVEIGYRSASGFEGGGSACYPSPEILCIALVASVEADIDLWTATVVPKWQFEHLTVLARIGAAYYDQEISVTSPSPGKLGNITGTELLYGAGVRIPVRSRLEILLDYERIEVGLTSFSGGLGVRF